jgi:hypothetical protein
MNINIRQNVFETNSSSTHSFAINPNASHICPQFIAAKKNGFVNIEQKQKKYSSCCDDKQDDAIETGFLFKLAYIIFSTYFSKIIRGEFNLNGKNSVTLDEIISVNLQEYYDQTQFNNQHSDYIWGIHTDTIKKDLQIIEWLKKFLADENISVTISIDYFTNSNIPTHSLLELGYEGFRQFLISDENLFHFGADRRNLSESYVLNKLSFNELFTSKGCTIVYTDNEK